MNKNIFSIKRSLFFIFTFILLSGCSEDDPVQPPTVTTGATVSGYVRSLNSSTAVQNVTVNLRSKTDDNLIDSLVTLTNAEGYYQFTDVSAGVKILYFLKGSFRDTISVTVDANATIIADTSHLEPEKPLAYLPGQYDDIQTIIRDSLGYNVQSITVSAINNNINLNGYSIIFLNCGSDALSNITNAGANNLKAFMQSGGRIYASDWAYGTVIKMYPELSGNRNGNAQTVTGNITDKNLQRYMDVTNVPIVYDLASWYAINPNIDQTVNVPFIKATYTTTAGTVTNNVIAFYRAESFGKLIYTTFHNEANVTAQTIKILKYFVFEL